MKTKRSSHRRQTNRSVSNIAEDPKETAVAAGLRYVSDASAGIARRRKGVNFTYHDKEGRSIREPSELKRIRSLAIPPAWERVWISPHANGHLQATGIDAKGRKQYKYHPIWRTVRDEAKFERLLSFAEILPKIRAQVAKDMARPDLTREKVLATIVRLLEVSLIRIGNVEYAKENKSFGLTTMRNRHVEIEGATLRFQFRGKSGRKHTVEVSDRRVARVVQKCQDLPGQQLFEYENPAGEVATIASEDVNDYLQRITGQPFTAKDFRTWAGTVLAALALGKMEEVDSQTLAKRNIVAAIEAVARLLGNTVAICRKCYIHPAIPTSYLDGTLARTLRAKADSQIARHLHELKPEEAAVITLLRQELAERSRNGGTGRKQ
ncbi:MAG TPA: DNA topoisomerase IB [Chthoniobacterales bacterium]|nr:DNA topoisomerase IB [Chthoniobacterales bacterium]